MTPSTPLLRTSTSPVVSPAIRITALVCTLSLAIGSHYAAHTLGALKPEVKSHLNITNTQYALLQASLSLVNTVIPILGGVLLDRFGTGIGSMLATGLIAVGNIMVAVSTHAEDWWWMCLGRFVYGLGSGSIMVVQDAMLARWFSGTGLAVMIGFQIAVTRLASYLAVVTVYPLIRWTGFYGSAFWVAAFLCTMSFAANIVYLRMVRYLKREEELEKDARVLAEKRRFHPKALLDFPGAYWACILITFVLCANWTTFLHVNTELVHQRGDKNGMSEEEAANVAGLAQFLPIFIAPCLGYFHDAYGKRRTMVVIASLLFSLSAIALSCPSVSSSVGMLIASLSLSLGPVALTSSLTLLLPKDMMGTGLGLYKSMMHVGATLFDLFAGHLQDVAHGEYTYVLRLYIVVGIVSALVAFVGLRGGKWFSAMLEGDAKTRRIVMEEVEYDRVLSTKRWKYSEEEHVAWNRWMPVVACGVAMVASWGVFIVTMVNNH